MDDHATTKTNVAPPEWNDALDQGQADLAAGRTEPWLVVRARMVAEIQAMEDRGADRPA